MTPAETEWLRFRQMSASDLDTMATLLGDPEVMFFYPSVKTRDKHQPGPAGTRTTTPKTVTGSG